MSLENNSNEPKKDVNEQVKDLLSNLGGDNGEFLSQPQQPFQVRELSEPYNMGTLIGFSLVYKCGPDCKWGHSTYLSLETFKLLFGEGQDPVYFENFKFSEWTAYKQLQEVLAQCETNEKEFSQFQTRLNNLQKVADRVEIEKAHLQVENTGLRRELDRTKAENERLLTGTALDLDYLPGNGRRWSFWNPLKGFHLVGRQSQEGK